MKDKTGHSILDPPVMRFVAKILFDAAERNASSIRLERHPRIEYVLIDPAGPFEEENIERRAKPRSSRDIFTINLEIEGELQQVAVPPVVLWEGVLSRLKILSGMVDYGPNKSTSGTFEMRVADNEIATFLVTTNPNPFKDNEVIVQIVEK